KMSAKKKSCFQITSVTQAQVATVGCADDAESLDDPDETRNEDATSEIYEPEACDRRSSAPHGALNSIGEGEVAAHRAPQPGQSPLPGQQTASSTNTTTTSCSSRFRVIKLDHGTGEPFRRGRWTCMDFYERETEVTSSRTSEGSRHTTEHAPERDSGLGASVVVQTGQASDVASNTPTMLDLAAPHASVHPFESCNDPGKTVQPAVPPQALLAPGLNQGSHVQISPVTPQAYQNQPQQNPQLSLGLHMPNQTGMMPEYGQQHLPHTVPMQGDIGISIPASQSGAPVPTLMDWAGVMSVAGIASLASGPSVQIGQYSGVAVPAGQHSPVPSAVGIPVHEQVRRKSDAFAAPGKEAGKPLTTEEFPLIPTPGVNSLFGIPIDGDEDRNPSTLFYKTFQPGVRFQRYSVWACAFASALDTRVCVFRVQDLVKSHLMYAVREEVEVLKEQIKELCERNSVLERENAVLKSLANNEQLSQLSTHTGAAATPVATPPPASNPPQP
ncbi:TSC22 domain family protein 2 isoform X1, partial [Silurus asotus]